MRGSRQGESHGGVYLVDFGSDRAARILDWNSMGIDWQGRGWDRGLRGIAFDRGLVYIAASDELFAFTPDFKPAGSWRNPYLKHCHEIVVYERSLYLASTGCDSILAFDLDACEFHWAMQVATDQFRFKGSVFDPRVGDGPLMLNKLHINSIHCAQGGMYITGLRTGGMLHFNGKLVRMAAELPPGSHNARPFRDGVLFNDTEANAVRYAGRGEGLEEAVAPTQDPIAARREVDRALDRDRVDVEDDEARAAVPRSVRARRTRLGRARIADVRDHVVIAVGQRAAGPRHIGTEAGVLGAARVERVEEAVTVVVGVRAAGT